MEFKRNYFSELFMLGLRKGENFRKNVGEADFSLTLPPIQIFLNMYIYGEGEITIRRVLSETSCYSL